MYRLEKINGVQRLFTYKVAFDGGSAPNPYHGICTLAICKPKIRSVAKPGDVIVGLGCGNDESRIIYCMVVDAVVKWGKYIEGCKSGSLIENNSTYHNLEGKIPKYENDQGDCIWKDANYYIDSLDSWSGHGGEDDFNRDVKSGVNVLIGKMYWYFGKGDKYKITLPDDLFRIIPGRGHRSSSNNDARDQFVYFFNNKLNELNITSFGVFGTPALVPEKSNKKTCSRCRNEEKESDNSGEEL